MKFDIPDRYTDNVGGALVERGARVIAELGFVPAYVWQYAELWRAGLRYDGSDVSYWQAVMNHNGKTRKYIYNAVTEDHIERR